MDILNYENIKSNNFTSLETKPTTQFKHNSYIIDLKTPKTNESYGNLAKFEP